MINKVTYINKLLKSTIVNILNEGIDWSKGDNNSLNFTINQNKDDNSNKGTNNADTRVFGTKDNILNGKLLTKTGEESNKSKSLEQNYIAKKSAIEAYNAIINYINNNRNGELILPNGIEPRTKTTINNWFKNGYSDKRIIDICYKSIDRLSDELKQLEMTYNRVKNTKTNNPTDKISRYITGIVPNTNVKYISLFSISDFNFSDAIKHGYARQNTNTDKILGINSNERELDDNGNYKTLPISYDGKTTPNIKQNFSLDNVKNSHYRQQYGLNGDDKYSSVSQFIDKSINYAAYALKQEGFSPDFIVSAPSSSKFNTYYCIRLSRKLGVEYEQDFFKRNVINVRYANGEDLASKGFSPKDILEFESQAKNVAFNEIAYFVSEPMRIFFNKNKEFFSNISVKSHSREKCNTTDVFDCIMQYAYKTIIKTLNTDNGLTTYLTKIFMANQAKLQRNYDSMHILKEVNSLLKLKIGLKNFNQVLVDTKKLVEQYSDILKNNGYKLRFGSKRFKITSFKKQYRQFLSNVYIIADGYLNNGELLSRYKNAKFLIFDEDINSGATLKLVIDALQEKLPDQTQNNILCLVNAYSNSGF